MTPGLIQISVGYAFLVALLCGVLFFTHRLNLTVKLILAVLTSVMMVYHYATLRNLAGWASRQTPPEQFELLGARIQEPDSPRKRAGSIEIWIQPQGSMDSRLYRLPYSRELQIKIHNAEQRRRQGRSQRGNTLRRKNRTGGGMELEFSDKPKSRLPSKQ